MKTQTHAVTTRILVIAHFFTWLAFTHGAWAQVVQCVSNDSQFAAAAATATFVPVKFELVQGTYHVDGTVFDSNSPFTTFQGFSLLGGFTANCASRQIDATNTILSTSASSQGLYGMEADVVGDVTIEGIHFSGAHAGFYLEWSDYFHDIPDSVNLVVRRNIISSGGGSTIAFSVSGSQTFSGRIVNNLIHDTSVSAQYGCALGLRAHQDSDATFDLINNTIVDNATSDGGVCMGFTGYDFNAGLLRAYNNIFYGNGGRDLDIAQDTDADLLYNTIGTQRNDGLVPIQIGTLASDPKLSGTFHPIESPPSPVINSGDNDVPGGLSNNDLDGGPRLVGSTVDRGAYESNVDDSFILTVTNTNDTGTGSLREAIKSANSNGGFNIIKFDIGTGCGPHTITLQSQLPAITSDVLINGYTQTGSAENDLDVGDDAVFCIVLDGGTNNIANGFNVPSGPLWVEGVAFSGFTNAAINLTGGSGHIIEGVRIGGSTSGGALDPSHDGIDVGRTVSGVTIGGSDDDQRNIIGDTLNVGILISSGSGALAPAHDNQIINNYVGVGWNTNTGNFTNLGNGQFGMTIDGRNNTISNNVVGFNFVAGILLSDTDGHDNTVSGNDVGVSPSGDNLGNSFTGVFLTQDAHDNTISGNTIADNGAAGVSIATGQHNFVSSNSIFGNAGLGIDLGGDGVTPNDNDSTPPAGDPANRLQNFPVLTAAAGGHFKGTVSGTLTSTPGDYRIEFFGSPTCDSSGNGEGEFYLGHTTITLPNLTVDGQTTVSFSKTLSGFYQIFPVITATATAQASGVTNDTSEFSACFTYTDDTIFANGFELGIF